MRIILKLLLLLILIPVAYAGGTYFMHTDLSKLPPLESGDLIFQSFINSQSPPIIFATGSIYTHVGVIHKHLDGTYTVIQAAQHVVETPLPEFVHGGWGERIAVLRYPGLTEEQRYKIIKDAESYLGRQYNYVFYMDAKEMYCSEIPYFAFKAAGLSVGTLEKIKDLHMNNPVVKNLFEQRWHDHPACQSEGMGYQACWNTVLELPIITPVSLRHDPKLETIYNNYY